MHYDYVDIGTCDFDYSNHHGDSTILLVEPLQMYLDNIAEKNNRIKANYAISNYNGVGKIYYVDGDDLKAHDLPYHLRGCNSFNDNHVTMLQELQSKNLLHLYKTVEVNVITFEKLLELYDITSIGKLKIDTEGHDHIILKTIYDYIVDSSFSIKQIQYEYYANNVFKNAASLEYLSSLFESNLKYSINKVDAYNVMLEKL